MQLSRLGSFRRTLKRARCTRSATLVMAKSSSLQMPRSAPVLVVTTVRPYARRTVRRTAVDVEEQTQTGTTGLSERTSQPLQQQEQEQVRTQQQAYAPGEETTESTITPDVRRHMTKVYGTMTAGLGFASIGALAGGMLPGLAIVGSLGGLAGIIGLAFTDRSKVTFRQNLFLGTTALIGMGIGPLVAASAPGVVFAAALGTSAIFGGFTLAALRAKSNSMLTFGGPLMGGLLMLVACSVAGLVLPLVGVTSPAILGALYNVNLYGGLILFSFFISYDTQRMIADYKAGDTDHVSPALSMFLNVINIFIRLLEIFRR